MSVARWARISTTAGFYALLAFPTPASAALNTIYFSTTLGDGSDVTGSGTVSFAPDSATLISTSFGYVADYWYDVQGTINFSISSPSTFSPLKYNIPITLVTYITDNGYGFSDQYYFFAEDYSGIYIGLELNADGSRVSLQGTIDDLSSAGAVVGLEAADGTFRWDVVTSVSFSGDNPFYLGPVAAAVPETSTWAMLLIGFGGLAYTGYRRKRRPDRDSLRPSVCLVGHSKLERRLAKK
jgi:hypothetical protein